jgi:autoaggregation protein RapA/B/C
MPIMKPVAENDFFEFSEGEQISGNFLENDAPGLNGKKYLRFFNGENILSKKDGQITEVDGLYGTFYLKSDGSFTYNLFESSKNGLISGVTLTESLTYKVSDGLGNTDIANITLNIKGETVRNEIIKFDFDNEPYVFDFFSFGTTADGEDVYIVSENENNFWQADPWGLGFRSTDGTDFRLTDMIVATGAEGDGQGLVTFSGYRNNRKIGEVSVLIEGDSISDQQHVSLASLGYIDGLTYSVRTMNGEWSGLPTLLFDDITIML